MNPEEKREAMKFNWNNFPKYDFDSIAEFEFQIKPKSSGLADMATHL